MADQPDSPPPEGLDDDGARALGWSLKELCYASWSSDPPRAGRAADALARLYRAVATCVLPATRQEIRALAAWCTGIACLIRGSMSDAAEQLEAAAAAFTGIGQVRHAALTQVPRIMALTMLGRHEDATRCALDAKQTLLALGDAHAAGRVALNLGNVHLRRERHADAAPHFLEAQSLFAAVGDQEQLVMAEIGLADTHAALGQPAEAARVYERARARAAAQGLPVLQAMIDESVALLDLARGQYREALAGLERARQGYSDQEALQRLAIVEKLRADVYLELRLLPEALAGFDATLQRFRALDMAVDQALTLVQRGRALALAGQPGAAAVALDEGARLFAAQDSGTGLAAVALARAELALAKQDGACALELARQASQIYDQAGLVQRHLRADAVAAQALLQTGEIAASRTLFDDTFEAARAHLLLPVQLRCLTGRAMTARAVGERQAARANLDAAVDLFEDLRRALPGDEVRSAFQADHLLPFQELLRDALAKQDERPDNTAHAAEVLSQLDRFRARTLADRLVSDGRSAPTRQDALANGDIQDLHARLAWLYRRLQHLDDAPDAAATLMTQLHATERQLLEQERRARLAEEGAGGGRIESDGLDLSTLRSRLAPSDAIVEFGVLDDELFACVVTSGAVHVQRRMASWRRVLDNVRWLRFQLESPRQGGNRLRRHLPELELRMQLRLQELHELLWRPLAAKLPARARVLIVPHAQLGMVPFGALHGDGSCLLERHQLALAPSARIAQRVLASRPRPIRRVLALGESSRLAHAAREATAVAGLVAEGTALVGEAASLANLSARGPAADVIHLACHAQFRADNPVFSALQLHDGLLTAAAVERMRLPCAVVVLSACETALHDAGGGDEIFGLTRAFLVAGAERVLASLCTVDDATTAQLMSDLYTGLRRGQAPAAALRLAQLAARRRFGHPYYWASFVLVGGW